MARHLKPHHHSNTPRMTSEPQWLALPTGSIPLNSSSEPRAGARMRPRPLHSNTCNNQAIHRQKQLRISNRARYHKLRNKHRWRHRQHQTRSAQHRPRTPLHRTTSATHSPDHSRRRNRRNRLLWTHPTQICSSRCTHTNLPRQRHLPPSRLNRHSLPGRRNRGSNNTNNNSNLSSRTGSILPRSRHSCLRYGSPSSRLRIRIVDILRRLSRRRRSTLQSSRLWRRLSLSCNDRVAFTGKIGLSLCRSSVGAV